MRIPPGGGKLVLHLYARAYAEHMNRIFAGVLILSILIVALFGMYLMLAMPHAHGCPLVQTHEMLCSSTVIEHIQIWNALTASLLILALFVCIPRLYVVGHTRFTTRIFRHARAAPRPTLMQELCARGLLNWKAP